MLLPMEVTKYHEREGRDFGTLAGYLTLFSTTFDTFDIKSAHYIDD